MMGLMNVMFYVYVYVLFLKSSWSVKSVHIRDPIPKSLSSLADFVYTCWKEKEGEWKRKGR